MEPRRILVIKLGHIGDVLVTTPVISALKTAFPRAAVTALVNQGTEAMLQHNPHLDTLLVLRREHPSPWRAASRQLHLLRRLRRGRFDLSLELSGGDRGAFLSLAAGAGLRVGFAPKKPHLRARAFHLLADQRGTQNHVVETFLRQVRALGLEPGRPPLVFRPGPQAERRAGELLERAGISPGGYALVHPTSRWMFKSWTPAGNAQVIRRLLGRGLPVVLTCAPQDKELAFLRAVRAELGEAPGLLDLGGRLDLLTLGALIQRARVFFGVDSAPMHMAAALGVPQVVLFGPSGERMWGPWRAPGEVVALDWDCRPCGRDGCDGSKLSRCLLELPPEMVIAALERVLEQGG